MVARKLAPSSYAVVAPGPTVSILVGGALALCFVAVAITFPRLDIRTPAQPGVWFVALGILVGVALACQLIWRRSVSLLAGVLVIKAGINTRRVPVTRLELERARIIDLEECTELQPGFKTFGSSLPGYQTGWFRTRKWGKGFYLLTDRRRVLWLPEHDGPHLLLSLQQPQALLSALNALVARRIEHE